MTITNGYASLAQLKAQMRISASDSLDDLRLELAVAAASRQIDAHTGRRFWQDATVQARQFVADDSSCCYVDDISTTTGLIVKIDDDDDGVYETTWTIGTQFLVWPYNAADDVPVRPYERLILAGQASDGFPTLNHGRPGVEVTAKFGWPAIPDDVTKACLVQAGQLFKSDDAAFGVAQFAEAGVALRVTSRMHPIAEALLEPYLKPRIG